MDTETRNTQWLELFSKVNESKALALLRRFAVGYNLTPQDCEDAWSEALAQSLSLCERFVKDPQRWLYVTARYHLLRGLSKGKPTTAGYWRAGKKMYANKPNEPAKWVQADRGCEILTNTEWQSRLDTSCDQSPRPDAGGQEGDIAGHSSRTESLFYTANAQYERVSQTCHPRRIKTGRVSVSPNTRIPAGGRGRVIYNWLRSYGKPIQTQKARPYLMACLKEKGFSPAFKWTNFPWLEIQY